MKLLTSFAAVAVALAFCSHTAHAQDSPIYLSDNGGIPIKLSAKSNAMTNSGKQAQGSGEIHIEHRQDHAIQRDLHDPFHPFFFVQESNHHAACLDIPSTPMPDQIDLSSLGQWTLVAVSKKDNLVISPSMADPTIIRIDPTANTKHRSSTIPNSDLDDSDGSTSNNTSSKACCYCGATIPLGIRKFLT